LKPWDETSTPDIHPPTPAASPSLTLPSGVPLSTRGSPLSRLVSSHFRCIPLLPARTPLCGASLHRLRCRRRLCGVHDTSGRFHLPDAHRRFLTRVCPLLVRGHYRLSRTAPPQLAERRNAGSLWIRSLGAHRHRHPISSSLGM